MRLLAELWGRVMYFVCRGRFHGDLSDEMREHLEETIEELVVGGMPVEEARYAAQREFGNALRLREESRDVWGFQWLETLLQDLRFGLRQLRRNPAFTAVAVITLALGIGANTAIFSLIDTVMFKLLPVQQPQRVFVLDWVSQGWPYFIQGIDGWGGQDKNGRNISTAFSYPVFEAIRARNHVFSSVSGFYAEGRLNVSVSGQSALAPGEFVSGDYFSTLGVKAVAGRMLTPADDTVSASPAAVISYRYWMQRFGGDPSLIGKAITVNDVSFTLVGVAARKFSGLQPGQPMDVWIPLRTHSQVDPNWWWLPKGESVFTARGEWWVVVVGRLKPGVSWQQADAQLGTIVQQNTAGIERPPAHPSAHQSLKPPGVELISAANGLGDLRAEFSRPLFVLMAVVALVLLVACANVANLLLARSTSRQREVAVRLALGAGRGRLIRQLLTESVLLAAAGGVLGVILAYWASDVLLDFISSGGEPVAGIHVAPDLRVLGFTALISVLTGILFGLVPALSCTRLQLTPALKKGPDTAFGTGRGARSLRVGFRDALVASQIAISLLLLIGAGLFVRTLTKLANQDLGFEHRNLLVFGIDPTQAGYKGEKLAHLYQELQRRIEALPGVRSASLSVHTPVGGGEGTRDIWIQGYVPKPGEAKVRADGSIDTYTHFVGSRFFETFGIPLLLGRTIGDGDVPGAPEVGVVNRAFAREYFGNADPIGRRFGFGGANKSSDIAIVGVVGDATYGNLRAPPPPTVYVPYAQHLDQIASMHFAVRTAGNPKAWMGSVRKAVQNVDGRLPLSDVTTQIEQIRQTTFQERLFADLTGLFSLLALLLACVGLYGVMAYAVAQRTNEIGIRMALGAQRQHILTLILQRGARLTAIGVVAGVVGALAMTRLIASFLFGVTATDPLTFVAAAIMLALVALLACYIPARRATKVDPVVALRHE